MLRMENLSNFDNNFKQIIAAQNANIYYGINNSIAILKNSKATDEQKAIALRLLIHLVGDLHEPLHVADFVVNNTSTRGGNNIKVLWFRDSANLHQVWDDKLIGLQQLSYTEYATAINHTTKEQVTQLQSEPMGTWLFQSYLLAQRIYGDIKKPNQVLDYKYNYNYLGILNDQLLKGGIHLAGMLNEIFGS